VHVPYEKGLCPPGLEGRCVVQVQVLYTRGEILACLMGAEVLLPVGERGTGWSRWKAAACYCVQSLSCWRVLGVVSPFHALHLKGATYCHISISVLYMTLFWQTPENFPLFTVTFFLFINFFLGLDSSSFSHCWYSWGKNTPFLGVHFQHNLGAKNIYVSCQFL